MLVEPSELRRLADQVRAGRELESLAIHAIAAHAQLLFHQGPGLGEKILLEEDADRIEAAPVNVAGAEAPERLEMLGGGVALVPVEAVLRKALVQRRHLGVTAGFGEDRGGGDALFLGVAIDDRLRAAAKAARAGVAVDPGFARTQGE